MRPEVLAHSLAVAVKGLLEPLVQRAAQADATIAALAARVVELEAREPRQGPPGPPGADGAPGLNGKDGSPGLVYCGVYVRGKQYDTGELVTAGGSAFHCNRLTTAAPGTSNDWTLMVKRGQDGKA